jgi:aryl-alcohol dehydrogenase-like predicted oxidoreductase
VNCGVLHSQLTFGVSQDESSEEFIGEWAEKRGIRDQLVIATKASPDLIRGMPINWIY